MALLKVSVELYADKGLVAFFFPSPLRPLCFMINVFDAGGTHPVRKPNIRGIRTV